MAAITGLVIASVIAALASAGAGIFGSVYNANKQEELNKRNLQNQEAINQANLANQAAINQQNINFSREFAQNQIQWRMDDLQNAGLNPTLAAGGGSSSPTAMQSTAQQSINQHPGLVDMSGIASAITALNNSMLTAYMIQSREDIADDRNATLRSTSEGRNSVLRQLYKRKGIMLDSDHDMPHVGNASQIKAAKDSLSDAEWKALMKELKSIKVK